MFYDIFPFFSCSAASNNILLLVYTLSPLPPSPRLFWIDPHFPPVLKSRYPFVHSTFLPSIRHPISSPFLVIYNSFNIHFTRPAVNSPECPTLPGSPWRLISNTVPPDAPCRLRLRHRLFPRTPRHPDPGRRGIRLPTHHRILGPLLLRRHRSGA